MAKLTYFGTQLSPNQILSKQGYLLCTNVPICRTGPQDYLGSELEGHPGYDPAWGLNPNERYPVLRPLEEVTSPATIASFEGATVVDEHPNSMLYPGSLVTAENDAELNRGHGQNIRVGEPLDDGETPLIADLHVKDIDLIRKIDSGIRDVSCGYTFTLARRADGVLLMTNIRGNHIAVVPTGRAGKEVAIGDAEPPKPEVKEKKPVKNTKDYLLGLGLMAAMAAKDADPEEVAKMAKEAAKDDLKPDAEEKAAKDKAAKDAEAEEKERKAAVDAEDVDKVLKDAETAFEAAKERKAAKDKKAGKDAPDVEDLDDMPSKAEVINDAADPELDLKELGESALKGKGVLDSARSLVQVLKPWIGSGNAPKAAVDAYNAHVKALNATKGANPYAAFVQVQAPFLALDAQPVDNINPRTFFEGRTFEEGNAAYRAHLAAKGAK